MRVVVNELGTLGRQTGVGHYTHELLRCLREQAPPGSVASFPQGWLRRVKSVRAQAVDSRPAEGDTGPQPVTLRQQMTDRLRGWARRVELLCFRAFSARHRAEVYHEPNHIPLPSDLPTVVTVHDLSALLHPEWHSHERAAQFARHFPPGLERCRHLLAVSEFTRQEIIRTLNVPPERVTRVYNGIRPGLRPLPEPEIAVHLQQLGLPSRYLLYVGTLEPRKNLLTLLEAYCGLSLRIRDRYPLVLVGGWGWKADAIADYLDRHARARGVLHLGYVAEQHLAALYNGARALVYPSLYEGFGLPPVEMLACGGAVLASTAGALVETVGGQAQLIAPEDTDGWRDGLARVAEDDDWWHWLRDGAVQTAAPFTWDRCAAETLTVYRAVCGARTGRPELSPYRAAG